MPPSLGTVEELNVADLAAGFSPRERVTIYVVETDKGWHSFGFHMSKLVWESGVDLHSRDLVITLFVMAGGKYAFQRTSCSAPEAVHHAMELIRRGRHAVYRRIQTHAKPLE